MTRAEQRLNSNHGRLMRAAAAVPDRLRGVPVPGWDWTPRDMLAHVLAWQEEALRRLAVPDAPWPTRADIDAWNAVAHRRLRDLAWDEVVARLEANHRELRTHLIVAPPRWFGPCTYWHYTEHTRALLGFLESFDQSPTTTAVPVAAQS
ncbi:MAG TPA: DinB family protein [Candidatus Dormibacteraeota bacterium]|nr:DinB family protein [Candidatus Dormibacteraeota bacterium]